MGNERSVDPQVVENTVRQIRELASEISHLAKQDQTPQEFYAGFLTRVVTALAAAGGAVWLRGDDGALQLEFQVNLAQTGLHEDQEAAAGHHRLLYETLARDKGDLVMPRSGATGETAAANPTNYLLVLGLLRTHNETVGIVEVFQRPDAAPAAARGHLRFLSQMCDVAGEFIKTRSLRDFHQRQELWDLLEGFTRAAHSSLDPRLAAYTIANEGRRLIGCDRVTVALSKGGKCKVQAISGQETFDSRANTVYLLNRLATVTVAGGEDLWYTGDTSDMAPQVEEAVQAYIDESQSKLVAVLPLVRPVEDEESENHVHRPPLGALIVEQIDDVRQQEGFPKRVEVVRDHSCMALANAVEHQNLFLMPLWRAIGRASFVVQARTLPKTLAISGAVLVALLALIFAPGDFELEGRGALQPVKRRDVFAHSSGVVDYVKVRHGDEVKKGTPLVELHNMELEVEQARLRGERLETIEELTAMQTRLLSGRLSPAEKDQIAGHKRQLVQSLKNLNDQIELHDKKIEQLQVASPIAGEVVTCNVYDRLIKRPVERGQLLMTVADPSGEWELEVNMPEDRIGHITREQLARANQAREQGKQPEPLTVEFILATDPGTTYEGKVLNIQHRAEVHGEEGNMVLIRVAIDKNILPPRHLLPGAGVVARVRCGSRSIGYVWFHELIEFVQSRILFRM